MKSALLVCAFAAAFFGMWLMVARRVARNGWTDLVSKHRAQSAPLGKKIGSVSGWFPRSSYSSTLTVWIAPDGLFIRPVLLFRAFHPTLLIPWSSVASVSEEKKLLSKLTALECEIDGAPLMLHLPGGHQADFDGRVFPKG